MTERLRYKVFGRVFDFERRAEGWRCLEVGDDGKRGPANFVVPEFIEAEELPQFLYDLFHEQAAWRKGGIERVM